MGRAQNEPFAGYGEDLGKLWYRVSGGYEEMTGQVHTEISLMMILPFQASSLLHLTFYLLLETH